MVFQLIDYICYYQIRQLKYKSKGMEKGDRLSEARENLHNRIRNEGRQQFKESLRVNRIKNINHLLSQTEEDRFLEEIDRFQKELSPVDALKQTTALVDANQDKIQYFLHKNMDWLLEMTVKEYPHVAAIQLTRYLIRAEISEALYRKHQVVPRIIKVVTGNLEDEECMERGIEALLEVACVEYQNDELVKVKEFCIKHYESIRCLKSTLFLLSFLGRAQSYFPARIEILANVIDEYQSFQKDLSLIAFQIISQYIQFSPQLTSHYLQPIIQICTSIASQRNFNRGSSSSYRSTALKNIALLLEEGFGICGELVDQKVMLLVVNIIRMEPILMKEKAFRVLEGFSRHSQREEMNTLLIQVPDFLVLLEEQGLNSLNVYVREYTLRIILNGLDKYQVSQGQQYNAFKNQLESSVSGIAEIIDNLTYNKSQTISNLAVEIYQKYFEPKDPYQEEYQQ